MNASPPIDAPERVNRRGGSLFLFRFLFGFIARSIPGLWMVIVVAAVPKLREVLPSYFPTALWVMFFVSSVQSASLFVQQCRWILPLGHFREAVLLWWWRVPLTPSLAFLAGIWSALEKDGGLGALIKMFQGPLWAAGLLAALSLVQTLLPGTRPSSQAIRLLSVVSVGFVLCLSAFSPRFVAMLNSGDYDLLLNVAAAVLVPLSYWTLRFLSREEFLRDAIPTEQSAARELEARGAWRRVLWALDGGLPVGVGRRHWGVQLLARCFLSTHAIFIFSLNVVLHYGFAFSAQKARANAGDAVMLFLVFGTSLLPMLDPRVLRRQPLSAFSMTGFTMATSVFAAAFCILPTFLFERVSGTWEVRCYPSHLFSLASLGVVWMRAALLLVVWTGSMLLGLGGMREEEGAGSWMRKWLVGSAPLLALLAFVVGQFLFRAFRESWGWRSDFGLGTLVLLGSGACYYGAIRWGDRIYRASPRLRA